MSDGQTDAEFLSANVQKIGDILNSLKGSKRIEHLRAFIAISKIVIEVTESKRVSRKDRMEFLEEIKNPLVSVATVSFNNSINPEEL